MTLSIIKSQVMRGKVVHNMNKEMIESLKLVLVVQRYVNKIERTFD